LITLRGYGRVQATADFAAAWQDAAGPSLARHTRPGRLVRGQLEITVTNSAVLQELTYQKQRILAELEEHVPDARIRDLRFRIGAID
jgi:predicted nucleic acid-binding Zn ribbon protein